MASIKNLLHGLAGQHRPSTRDAHLIGTIRDLTADLMRGRAGGFELAQALVRAAAHPGLADEALAAVSAAGPRVWVDLDLALRSWRFGRTPPAPSPGHPLAVALMACDRDGRQRHKAIKQPVMKDDPRLYPLLVIRSADWAQTVRDTARRLLEEVLRDADVPTLLQIVPAALAIAERHRGDHAFQSTTKALRHASDDVLHAVCRSEDLPTRRLAYQIAIEAGRLDEHRLLTASLKETDVVSRVLCARSLAETAVAQKRPEPLERMLDSRSAGVRIEALTGLVRLDRPEAGRRFLADGSSMMRLTAQWAVRRSGHDPAEVYRQKLADHPERRAREWIAGLADCGDRDDTCLLLPYLADGRSRVRAEAVKALRRLGGFTGFGALLEDPAPIVVRHAALALRTSVVTVPAERLWTLLVPERPRHVRQAAHHLLTAVDVWTRFQADLVLLTDLDEELVKRARADLRTWPSSSVAPLPSEQLRQRLEILLTEAEAMLTPARVRELRWYLRMSR